MSETKQKVETKRSKEELKRMSKIHAGIIALAAKLGPKLISVVVKFAKAIKVGKFGLAIGSMTTY